MHYDGPVCGSAREQHMRHLLSGQLNGTRYGKPWVYMSKGDRQAYWMGYFRDPSHNALTVRGRLFFYASGRCFTVIHSLFDV
jgi:hypothetical protein